MGDNEMGISNKQICQLTSKKIAGTLPRARCPRKGSQIVSWLTWTVGICQMKRGGRILGGGKLCCRRLDGIRLHFLFEELKEVCYGWIMEYGWSKSENLVWTNAWKTVSPFYRTLSWAPREFAEGLVRETAWLYLRVLRTPSPPTLQESIYCALRNSHINEQ